MNKARTLVVLLFVGVLAAAPWTFRVDEPRIEERLLGPSAAHWAGTDHLGRDVLARTIVALADACRVVLPAWAIATLIGIALGLFAATSANRWVTWIVQGATRVVFATPFLLALVGLGAVIGRGSSLAFVLILLWAWAAPARLAYALARDASHASYTSAARAMGYSALEISRWVLVPVCVVPVFIANAAIIVELLALDVALTLFGFGPPPPHPTLGSLVSEGLRYFTLAPWMAGAPIITMCVLCVLLRAILQKELGPKVSNHVG